MKTFNQKEITEVYNKHCKLSPDYFKKYENILEHVGKTKWDCKGNDFPRVWCVLDFAEWIYKHGINPVDKLLTTSLVDPEMKHISYNSVRELKYDEITEDNDLHNFYLREEFDFCLFSQTLEHLYNPQLAIENIGKHIKKGGYVFTSVPTINIPHCTPGHFFGIYPMGLATMFIANDFEVVEMGQWGNKKYIDFMFEKHTWPGYDYLLENGMVPNEERNVCQCWILAKKL